MSAALAVKPWDYESEPKEAISECNLCGGKRFTVMAVRDRYGLPVETDGCMTCGLLFLNPRMTEEAYARFYAEGHYRTLLRSSGKVKSDPGQFAATQSAYALALSAFMAPLMGAGRTVLDIGGAPGVVARTLADVLKCKSVLVADPAPCQPGVLSLPQTLEQLDAREAQWDVILMCETVDHLLDLKGGLSKVRKLLKDDGLFFVDVAELRRSLKWYGGGLFNVTKVDHPYCIAEEVMEYALRSVGLEVVRKTYAMTAWHVGYLCRKSVPARPAYPNAEAILREVRR